MGHRLAFAQVIGLGVAIASQAGAYVHPLTAVYAAWAPPSVLNHPLPASNVVVLFPDTLVYVGTGIVVIDPV